MKQLLLLRHAQTHDSSDSGRDRDRTLTPHGFEQAKALRKYLAEHDFMPDKIVSSDATRTRQTVETLDLAGTPTEFEHSLYHASAARLLDEVFATHKEVNRLLLVAHNPGVYDFARMLTGEKDQDFYSGYPTCGLSIFQWDEKDWHHVGTQGCVYLGLALF